MTSESRKPGVLDFVDTGAVKGPGPVSSLLEAQLRESVRRHGVVVWLDLDDQYSAFVDRLQRYPALLSERETLLRQLTSSNDLLTADNTEKGGES